MKEGREGWCRKTDMTFTVINHKDPKLNVSKRESQALGPTTQLCSLQRGQITAHCDVVAHLLLPSIDCCERESVRQAFGMCYIQRVCLCCGRAPCCDLEEMYRVVVEVAGVTILLPGMQPNRQNLYHTAASKVARLRCTCQFSVQGPDRRHGNRNAFRGQVLRRLVHLQRHPPPTMKA